MDDSLHDVMGFSMEQTRYLLKRIVDGESRLVADLICNSPMQLLDVMMCAATMLAAIQKNHPEIMEALFTKALPN